MPIRILAKDVYAKIAAGEVVERPASVVKELIENSLDAGATEIRIDIEDGGKKLIRVTDNGAGISRDDLDKLFLSHATSKISCVRDLMKITTYGFRGEAIASISAVSKCIIMTKPRGADTGFKITNLPGDREIVPAACNHGTMVEVRDLFHNIPARLKFLKGNKSESTRIEDVITRLALANSRVRFECHGTLQNRVIESTDDLRKRISDAVGNETRNSLIRLELSSQRVTVSGYICSPSYTTTASRLFYLNVNGRAVRDPVIHKALMRGYSDFIPSGRNPVYFIFINADPSEVDVNVHPSKSEVRFTCYNEIFTLIENGVRNALLKCEVGSAAAQYLAGARDSSIKEDLSQAISSYWQRPSSVCLAPAAREEIKTQPLLLKGKRFIQMHGRFIVEESDDGISIIDQHALHERILLEELKSKVRNNDLPRQYVVVKSVIRLPEREAAIILDNKPLLECVGFVFEMFGEDKIRIVALPAILSGMSPETLTHDIVSKLDKGACSPDELLEEMLSLIACKAAVKFNDKLSDEEIRALLERRSSLQVKNHCAHGRNMEIKLTFDDLLKLFQRK